MKEYSKKQEDHSRAMQPQVDGHTQGIMERVLQRFSLFQRKKDSPAGCSVVAQKQAEPTVETSVENRSGLVSSLSENRTGMPDSLKTGVEQLSGYSLDDVRVHYNSSQPAQLQALAFAQGTDIHIAPGQESSLPHEAWHVVQQKQGRVRPTLQLQGVNVNDNESLEKEADVMGHESLCRTDIPTQLKRKKTSVALHIGVVQRDPTPVYVSLLGENQTWNEQLGIKNLESTRIGGASFDLKDEDKGINKKVLLKHYMVVKDETKYQLPVKHFRKPVWDYKKRKWTVGTGEAMGGNRGGQPEAFGGTQDWNETIKNGQNNPLEEARKRTLIKEYAEESGKEVANAESILDFNSPTVKKIFTSAWGAGTLSVVPVVTGVVLPTEGSQMLHADSLVDENDRGKAEMLGTITIDLNGVEKTNPDAVRNAVRERIRIERNKLIGNENDTRDDFYGESEIFQAIVDLIVEDHCEIPGSAKTYNEGINERIS